MRSSCSYCEVGLSKIAGRRGAYNFELTPGKTRILPAHVSHLVYAEIVTRVWLNETFYEVAASHQALHLFGFAATGG